MIDINQNMLKELFHYDHNTGVFTRKISKGNSKIGNVVGCKKYVNGGKSYLIIKVNYINRLAHRLAWLYMNGSLPEGEIDHINGNGCDNRISNLRVVNRSENGRNLRRSSSNKSGITGVSWFANKCVWQCHISINGKNKNLGCFKSIFDAAIARKNAEVKYGFHKNHGSDRPL